MREISILFWVSGFDIIYSLQDEDFDKKERLYSIPVVIGKKNALKISALLHLVSIILLFLTGNFASFGIWYWIGLSIFTMLIVYQHTLVKHNDLSKVNIAFFTTNGIGSLIFGGFVIFEFLC